MKELAELLQKLPLQEFFAYVAPGLVLELSILIWCKLPAFVTQNGFVSGAFAVIAGYGLAFVLPPGYHRIFRLPCPTDRELDEMLRPLMQEVGNGRSYGFLPFIPSVERLTELRTCIDLANSDQDRPDGKVSRHLRDLADSAHIRFIFAAGLASALLILGIQLWLRLALNLAAAHISRIQPYVRTLPKLSATALIVGGVVLVWGYFRLRRRARQEWLLEAEATFEFFLGLRTGQEFPCLLAARSGARKASSAPPTTS